VQVAVGEVLEEPVEIQTLHQQLNKAAAAAEAAEQVVR
jgi:hypothetical protein